MSETKKLTATQIEKLAVCLQVLRLFGQEEEARAKYRQLVAVVGDAEAGKVLAAAR